MLVGVVVENFQKCRDIIEKDRQVEKEKEKEQERARKRQEGEMEWPNSTTLRYVDLVKSTSFLCLKVKASSITSSIKELICRLCDIIFWLCDMIFLVVWL